MPCSFSQVRNTSSGRLLMWSHTVSISIIMYSICLMLWVSNLGILVNSPLFNGERVQGLFCLQVHNFNQDSYAASGGCHGRRHHISMICKLTCIWSILMYFSGNPFRGIWSRPTPNGYQWGDLLNLELYLKSSLKQSTAPLKSKSHASWIWKHSC